MSLILDALKKADEDRPETAGAALVQPEIPVSFPPPKKNTPWFIWGGAAAGVLLLALVFIFFTGDEAQPTPVINVTAPVTSTQPQKTSVAPRALPNPIQQATKPKPVIAVDPAAIDSLYDQPQNQPPSEIDSLYGQANDAPAAKTQPQPVKAVQTKSNPNIEQQEVGTTETVDAAPASEEKEYLTLADYPGVKNIRDLSTNIQNAIPTLMYTDHIYAESSLDIIMINRMPLRNGDSSPEGVKVERIVEDGAVIVYKGYRFKMFALNSWVNL